MRRESAYQTDSTDTARRVAMGGPGLTVLIAREGHQVLFVNRLFTEYTGYDESAITGTAFPDLLSPYERERFERQLISIDEGRYNLQDFVIYQLAGSDGHLLSFCIYCAVSEPVSEGEPAGYQLLLIPNPSEQNIPYNSSETRALFLKHFEADGFGTFEWVLDIDIVFWSAGVYKIYEVNKFVTDINVAFTRKFIHPDDRQQTEYNSQIAISTHSDLDTEFRIITESGVTKVLHCLGLPVSDNSGRVIKFIGSVRDISKQRAIEENLRHKMEELRWSNRELEDFAYAASHDLQEPLRKITTFSDRLREKYRDSLAGEGEMYLSRMVASADNMRLLINGLLDFSRISRAHSPFAQVSLGIVVKQVMSDLELKIEETNTTIDIGILPVVDAEASQMKQLFTNLISNAIKFHRKGVPPVINISSLPVSETDIFTHGLSHEVQYHKIVVSDNGIGFENEYAGRIFQVFQRLHGKSEYPGSGVGLAICKKILEHHNGVIYAESRKDYGATFVMFLPHRQK